MFCEYLNQNAGTPLVIIYRQLKAKRVFFFPDEAMAVVPFYLSPEASMLFKFGVLEILVCLWMNFNNACFFSLSLLEMKSFR